MSFFFFWYLFTAKDDTKGDIRRHYNRLYISAYLMTAVIAIFCVIKLNGIARFIIFLCLHSFSLLVLYVYSILMYDAN